METIRINLRDLQRKRIDAADESPLFVTTLSTYYDQ